MGPYINQHSRRNRSCTVPNEIFPTLRPHPSDSRTKSKKHTPVGMEELSTFITEMVEILEKINDLLDQMMPVFLERQQQISDKMKGVKEKLREMNVHRAAIRTGYGG